MSFEKINTVLTPEQKTASIIGKQTKVTLGGGVANDSLLFGIAVTKALTGTCVIGGFADSDGTATNITLPALTAVGYIEFGGIINAAGAFEVTCSNAADDNNVVVVWRPA